MKLLEHNHFISAPAGRLLELVVNINGIEFPMVYIPGGAFKMGTDAAKAREFCDRLVRSHSVTKFPAEGPEHEVYLKGYYISRFEVTRDIWSEVMGTDETIQGNPKLPVDNISYDEIRTFIRQMNKGLYFPTTGFSLPTEAQWERAARGGLESAHFPWGNDLAEHKYVKLVGSGPLAPGSFPENGFGLYDMAGNVAEICSDEYQTDSYRESMYYKPKVFRKKDKPVVVRGGSWNDDLCAMRVSARRPIDPHDGEEGVGFRLVWCLTIGII